MKEQMELLTEKRRMALEEIEKFRRGEWANAYWIFQTIPLEK